MQRTSPNLRLLLSVALLFVAAGTIGGLILVKDTAATAGDTRFPGFSSLSEDSAAPDGSLTPAMKSLLAMSGTGSAADEYVILSSVETMSKHAAAVVEHAGKVCLILAPRGPSSCRDSSLTTPLDLSVVGPISCATSRVTGLVPDGIDTLLTKGADPSPIQVSNNLFSARLPSKDVRLVSENGEFELSLPLGWYASNNSECDRSE